MFALLFDEGEQAERARAVLEPEGFEVDLQRQADSSLIVVAVPQTVGSSAETMLARMRSLAADLGGEVLGHGGLASYGLG